MLSSERKNQCFKYAFLDLDTIIKKILLLNIRGRYCCSEIHLSTEVDLTQGTSPSGDYFGETGSKSKSSHMIFKHKGKTVALFYK